MDTLQALILASPYFRTISKEDIMIGVTDLKEFRYYAPSSDLDLGVREGDPIPPDDRSLNNALRGQTTANRIPADIYGYPVDSIAMPIQDAEGQVIGTLAVAYTLKNEEKLEQLTSSIETISSQLLDMVQSVAAQSRQLTAASTQVLDNSRQAVANSQDVNKVTSFIKEISEQTNLLGLNAAIEAARVGEAGAGFGVVASEVRKLSVHTKEATQNIEHSLGNVQLSIRQMERDITSITNSSSSQVELMTDFSDTIERLNEVSSELKAFIESLVSLQTKN
ncbi:methyl-accepting chemotaxis protein [Paenibacillus sp. JX-17]|uniref:Methyl-accepting chemotaxis protein n=1 Tax=Paenibacillus lacisoli TaxID=3064525 RepID=A0ABT9CB51_9BACL|nr:methyl-accepting chemotaxis protein [Paenibacillus sp. JX-17]MDO7906484.1 methyl-accepting chemotaxis protein [Paenibacillus sp. JX-17]